MKTLIFILLFSFTLVGCSSAGTAPPGDILPTATYLGVTPSPLPLPTKTPTIVDLPTQSPTVTAPPKDELVWSPEISPIFLDGVPGSWSPTANEIFLYRCHQDSLKVAQAPDFIPMQISPYPVNCVFVNSVPITWSPDGQRIYFGGPLPENYEAAEDHDVADLWAVDRNGQNLGRIFPGGSPHSDLDFKGWLGNQILFTWSYGGGGHQSIGMLDTKQKNFLGGAFFYGKIYRSNNQYLAAITGEPSMTAFAIGSHPQAKEFELASSEYAKPIPFDGLSLFLDWFPKTNKMLALGFQYGQFHEMTKNQLLIWDVDNDTIDEMVSGGIGGLFSPDGQYLVYVTQGPATLDNANRPAPIEINQEENLAPYFQLLNLANKKVSMSLPITSDDTIAADFVWEPFHPNITFSPDSKYMGFVTTTDVKLLDHHWLSEPQQDEKDEFYLAVVDLENEQLVFSQKGNFLPVWSPQGNRFLFFDEENNLALFDVDTGLTKKITENAGKNILNVSWSFDGSYIAVKIENKNDDINTVIVPIPQD